MYMYAVAILYRQGLESHILRFLAMLETKLPIDKDRRFVISVFLSDDTVAVYEPPQRNSGIIGGNFLTRGRVVKEEAGAHPTTHHDQFYEPEVGSSNKHGSRTEVLEVRSCDLQPCGKSSGLRDYSTQRCILNLLLGAVLDVP